VILLADGDAEEGHDTVTEELIEGATVGLDGVGHDGDGGEEDLAGGLGGAVGDHLGGADDVDEEDGAVFEFALGRGWRAG
jgi:hypothetical protein